MRLKVLLTAIGLYLSMTGQCWGEARSPQYAEFDCAVVKSLSLSPGEFVVHVPAISSSAGSESLSKVQAAACMATFAAYGMESSKAAWLKNLVLAVNKGAPESPLDAAAIIGNSSSEPTLWVTTQLAEAATVEQLTWVWGHELSHAIGNDPGVKQYFLAAAIFFSVFVIVSIYCAVTSSGRTRLASAVVAISLLGVPPWFYWHAKCARAHERELAADVYGVEVLKRLKYSHSEATQIALSGLEILHKGNPPQKTMPLGCLTPDYLSHPAWEVRAANLRVAGARNIAGSNLSTLNVLKGCELATR